MTHFYIYPCIHNIHMTFAGASASAQGVLDPELSAFVFFITLSIS